MNQKPEPGSILIIGGGFAGLAAGIYGQMNGYKTTIFEMHGQPGGLCTAWKRKGFTIDGCIHWLVGSSPESGIHDFWEETGVAKNLRIINMDEYMRFEGSDGRTLVFYTDMDKLKNHLLEFSPQDKTPIMEFIRGIKMCLTFAYLHKKNAGYPLGGSMPMSEDMAKRYVSLGGTIRYKSKVEKILTENNKVSGLKLEDGTSYYAERVISAADGYSTLFKMLDARFGNAESYAPYEKWKPFPPLIYAGIGVNRTFNDLPVSVSGTIVELRDPVKTGNALKNCPNPDEKPHPYWPTIRPLFCYPQAVAWVP